VSKAVKYDDIDLMRYVDGEAQGQPGVEREGASGGDLDDAGDIASFIVTDPDSRLKVEALEQMSDLLRSHLELAADEAEPRLDAMWATIERRIQTNGVGQGVRATPAAAATEERGGLLAAIGRFFGQYRGHFLTGAVAAGAAAALILALRPPAQVVVERTVVVPAHDSPATRTAQERVNDSPAAAVKLVHDEPSPPEIEHLEVSGGSGTVFVMPREGEDDVAATMIFLEIDDVEGPL
jgi:hypothetical protein